MKLVAATSPYIRKKVSVKRMMLDVIIALMPITLFSMIWNGWSGIYLYLISLPTMVLTELIVHGITHWPKDMKLKELFTKDGFNKLKSTYTINQILAPVISALIYALTMPAGCNPYVVFIGAFVGLFVGKMVFGGLGSNIFNPAAVGRIFVAVCFGAETNKAYATQKGLDFVTGATPLSTIKTTAGLNLSLTHSYSILDLFLGTVPGAMGEGCVIAILVGAIYLFVRRSADIRATLCYFLTFAALMFVACLTHYVKFNEGNLLNMWLYQILAGGMIFGAVFMITDPVTSPTTKFGRSFYAIIAATIAVLIRVCGSYPEGVAFSILIANMLTPTIDYLMRGKPNHTTWRQFLVAGGYIILIAIIVSASVAKGWF